jgi:hypothetical protein
MKHAILLAVIPTSAFFEANGDLQPMEADGAPALHWAAQQDNTGGLPVKPSRAPLAAR